MITLLGIGIASLVWCAWLVRAGLVAARMFQIEEYEVLRFFVWGRQRVWFFSKAVLVSGAVVLLLALVSAFLSPIISRLGIGLSWLVGALVLHLLWKPFPVKKVLVYTPRMKRILGASLFFALLFAGGMVIIVQLVPLLFSLSIIVLLCLFSAGIVLPLIALGNVSMQPVERIVRKRYLQQARVHLAEVNPLVIGIAGSYGKTSTKHIAAELLAPYHELLATPKSFNTLMGITRTINEYLQKTHRTFLVEMDAYGLGEIADMCQLTKPTMAVITSVGPQHLERFGSIEKISDAIYELVAALPPGSPAIIYGGEKTSAQLAERARRNGYYTIRYGMEEETSDLDVIAKNVCVDRQATHFTWSWPEKKLEYQVSIPLLGQHNVLNVSATLILAQLLELPLDKIVVAASRLEPVPHRLQLIKAASGISIIDDSYNANPVGVSNGLKVLAQFQGKHKILVTPGMVELGAVEEEENRLFGAHAADVCDYVILVGERQTQPVLKGLQGKSFAQERIFIVQTMSEVTATLQKIARMGDVVLFANDLPDTYQEMK